MRTLDCFGGTAEVNLVLGCGILYAPGASALGTGTMVGLRGFPLVTLAEARAQAFETRRLAGSGGDSLAAKRRAKPPTFREAVMRTCEALRPRWWNRKHAKDWMATLERHAHPVIGNMNVDRIRREDSLRVLTPIWTLRPETARRVCQRMRAELRWRWSDLMRRIRKTGTKPEMRVRRAAHRLGTRFGLHRADLPGTPDPVFPLLSKMVLVNERFGKLHTDLDDPFCAETTTLGFPAALSN